MFKIYLEKWFKEKHNELFQTPLSKKNTLRWKLIFGFNSMKVNA